MHSLMSINFKFMEYTPEELIEITKDNKYMDGFEIYINFSKPEEIAYLHELVNTCKLHNKILQIHGDSSLPMDKQKEYCDMIMKISDILGYRISMVLHSISDEDKSIAIEKTTNYMKEITNYIDTDKIRIGLENLNDIELTDRLDKDEITPIVCNNERLFFTYDIGHEIADYGNVTNILWAMAEQISNVHIHTFDCDYDDGYDHKPIYKDDEHWQNIIKAILYLKSQNYQGNIVFEYDVMECLGETLKDKIKNYADSMDYVAERFK